MEFTDYLKILVSSVPYKIPILIVVLGGVVFAAINYSKNPSVNRRVIAGLILILIGELASLFVPLLNLYIFKEYGSQSEMIYVVFFISFLLALAFTVGLGLVLSAVWANRRPE